MANCDHWNAMFQILKYLADDRCDTVYIVAQIINLYIHRLIWPNVLSMPLGIMWYNSINRKRKTEMLEGLLHELMFLAFEANEANLTNVLVSQGFIAVSPFSKEASLAKLDIESFW